MSFATDKKPGIYQDAILGELYDVLVQHAGASRDPYDRQCFVLLALNWDYRFTFEYRFMGLLSSGGKIWLPLDGVPNVSCYPEHETPQRKKIIKETNILLERVVKP